MNPRSTDIIFLFGAGASVEADIPTSAIMISNIEELLNSDEDWKPYLPLYNHVKSAIYYSFGLKGLFAGDVLFNIESLVNALYELERNEEHPLYPFIASWNSRFVNLADTNFGKVKELRRLILKELKRWICPENSSKREYFSGLKALQRELGFPLNIFSLNYDLCVEYLNASDFRVETGFDGYGPEHPWNWERFESTDGTLANEIEAFLYKLHGSINWKRDEAKNLFSVEQVEAVEADKMDIIFGRDFKLEAADPYLFYAYQFRRSTMDAKLVVIIGYGFADSHINKMLVQGLRLNNNKKLHIVTSLSSQEKTDEYKQEIANKLEIETKRITLDCDGASAFLKNEDIGKKVIELVPNTEDAPF